MVGDLPVRTISLGENHGFAHANNVGIAEGSGEFVLFLNPDARIEPLAVERLQAVLAANGHVGAVGPKIVDEDGSLDFSQRRFPRLRSTFARAFFLHRLFPNAAWTDDLVRDGAAYTSPRAVDWISGACILARRDVLAKIDGWDDGFFHYGEDIDLCTRIWNAGFEVRFEPSATAVHIGGASADRRHLAPVLAESRIRYVRKHHGERTAFFVRIGVALEALARIVVGRGGWRARAGHARAFKRALLPTHRPPAP